MDDLDKICEQAMHDAYKKIADGLIKKSITQIFRERLVFFETRLKPFYSEIEYYDVIANILVKAGYVVSHNHVRTMCSRVAVEIGFDRKTARLDGRKKLKTIKEKSNGRI